MATPPGTDVGTPQPYTALPGLGWWSVLKHAWHHIRESWRTALVGALVTAVLPVLIQWGDSYDFSESGLDHVTAGGWIWSVVAVGAWLVLVAFWHVLCAPMAHAREVLSAHAKHHAAEIEQVRETAKAEAASAIPAIGQYVQNQWVLPSDITPEQAAEFVKQVPAVEVVRPERLEPALEAQAGEVQADDPIDDAGHEESGHSDRVQA